MHAEQSHVGLCEDTRLALDARSTTLTADQRARAAASIESVADAAAVASVTPDRAISGARAEQRAACAAQASEREQEQLRSRAQPTQLRWRASHPTGRSAAECAPSSERPVPPKLLRASKSSIDRECSRRSSAVASVTPDRATSDARAEQRAACAAQASEREQEQLRSRA